MPSAGVEQERIVAQGAPTMEISVKRFLLPSIVLLMFAGCDDSSVVVRLHPDGGASGGVCELSKCPQPEKGIACCTPDAACGTDPTGIGLGCTPNSPPDRVCKVSDCPTPMAGKACCTPLAECGVDPFENGVFCLPIPPATTTLDAGPPCDVSKCASPKNGPKKETFSFASWNPATTLA